MNINALMSEAEGQLQDYSVDQLAGAVVLILGAIGSLLLVIWQSRCHCRMNLCYIFQCERRPPSEDEMKNLKDKANELKKNSGKILKKEDEILKEEEVIQKDIERLIPQNSDSPKIKIKVEEEKSKDKDSKLDDLL